MRQGQSRQTKGSPPRVRGGGDAQGRRGHEPRITPACAGRSGRTVHTLTPPWDHPRVCGEEECSAPAPARWIGSPPRVRGGEYMVDSQRSGTGITPACAGRSPGHNDGNPGGRDHPRVCGEECFRWSCLRRLRGSPPRVRGGGIPFAASTSPPGITPACAGRSPRRYRPGLLSLDHPRVCGEEFFLGTSRSLPRGSPPRVRGGVCAAMSWAVRRRITPACAGRSHRPARNSQADRDHPRVCGEEVAGLEEADAAAGSPPRVRGGVHLTRSEADAARITPACAGRRHGVHAGVGPREDHPRVCGEET